VRARIRTAVLGLLVVAGAIALLVGDFWLFYWLGPA